MSPPGTRTYVSPLREAGAAATRRQILAAAAEVFEQRGWSGTTLSRVAVHAGVSIKTIQAQFGTKASLLTSTVDFAVRGEPGPESSARRGVVQAIRAAASAPEALALHARMTTEVNARAAGLAAVVEAGVAGEVSLVPLWERMLENMQFGVRWAAETVRAKPGLRRDLTAGAVETVFQIAMAWSTYRTLASTREMSREEIEAWIWELYQRMLLS
ncbi:MAG TPA: helix-turn-helix domain-containing protein [Solirubrobacteraceae bacterium]|nr:helix-turn-helix domain-containing protein [Solirubrobacteraceae bacterium]